MEKILVALIHPEEWNQYIPFNGYINSIRKNYDYTIGVIAEKPLILLSEVDEYYTVKDGLLNFSYPKVLDTPVRENHNFIDLCVSKIKKDYEGNSLEFVSWQDTNITKGVINIRDSAANVYRTSFKYAQEWYKSSKLIYPTKNTFKNIEKKYSHLFTDKTFIVMSRNFNNKATVHNTINSIPNFNSLVKFLTEKGLKIINIGFPPFKCDFSNENYLELNDILSQDELLSLFYLSQGVLMQSDAGGFVSHFSANSDFFILTKQWFFQGEFDSFDLISHKTKEVDTIDFSHFINDFEKIFNILNNYEKKAKNIFSKEKKINFVDVI